MKFSAWLASSLERHYPATPARVNSTLMVDVARNERFHFQVAVRQEGEPVVTTSLTTDTPPGWQIRIRRVGYIPMSHANTPIMPTDEDFEGRGFIPGLVPDPLFDATTIQMGEDETHAFWVTVIPSLSVKPGKHEIKLQVGSNSETSKTLIFIANLSAMQIPKRKHFPVTNWFYIDTLMAQYEMRIGEQKFWAIVESYLVNLVEHNQDTIYTSIFTVPLDGKRIPSQLLKVTTNGKSQYQFGWDDVKKFVDLAKKVGLEYFEWSHLFSQWGVNYAVNVYEGQGETKKLLWPSETKADSETYRMFLSQFLPAFHEFLERENLLECSFFHVSDEPRENEVKNYCIARDILKELAPWMKVMDAISDIKFADHIDRPISSIKTAIDFIVSGKTDVWCYFCCGPRGSYLNRLMDTPLAKIRMSGWLFYRWPFKGFLHWGYNYWNKHQQDILIDPFSCSDAGNWPGWAFGDTFLVYPGATGPIDSIRWEVFASSLQDYALLQEANVERDGPLLSSCNSFYDFPKTEDWINRARRKILFG